MISVDPVVYPFLSLLLLTVPMKWLLAALLAGLCHELAHGAAICLFGGKIRTIRIGIGGAEIQAQVPGAVPSFFSILAGPLGSLLLFLCYRRFPALALCAGIQGAFNLLPVYPLDGGRLLEILLAALFPGNTDRLQKGIEACFLLGMAILSVGICVSSDGGILPVLLSCTLIFQVILRKKPCKQGPNRIQ